MQVSLLLAQDQDIATMQQEPGDMLIKSVELNQRVSYLPPDHSFQSDQDDVVTMDPDEVIVPGDFRFIVDYPLENKVLVVVSDGPESGHTLGGVVSIIRDAYTAIYYADRGESAIEVVPIRVNLDAIPYQERVEEDGIFEINGHDIGELYIEGIRAIKLDADDDDDEYKVEIDIGS